MSTIIMQCKLVSCFVAFLNNKVSTPFTITVIYNLTLFQKSLEQMITNGKKAITKFTKMLFSSKNVLVKSHLVELMAAMALYSSSGYKYVNGKL